MRHLALALALLPLPAFAQQGPWEDFLDGLSGQAAQLSVLRDIARLMGDPADYLPPERLPNGDILIPRRATPEPEGTDL